MKKKLLIALFLSLGVCANATLIKSSVVKVDGGEVKPHDVLKINFGTDLNFTYVTTCTLLAPNFENNVIVGKVETSSYSGFSFNGKPMKDGVFQLTKSDNFLVIDPTSRTYQVKEIIIRNADNDENIIVRDCISTIKIS